MGAKGNLSNMIGKIGTQKFIGEFNSIIAKEGYKGIGRVWSI